MQSVVKIIDFIVCFLLFCILAIALTIYFSMELDGQTAKILTVCLCADWLISIIYSLFFIKIKTSLFVFLFCIFTLNFAKYFFFMNENDFWGIHTSFGISYISMVIECKAIILYILAVSTVIITYIVRSFFQVYDRFNLTMFDINISRMEKINKISKNLYYILGVLVLFPLFAIIKQNIQHGYLSLYLVDNSLTGNFIVVYFNYLFNFSFYSYLLTLQKVKIYNPIIISYIIFLLLTLGTGGRSKFVCGLIILSFFFFKKIIKIGFRFKHLLALMITIQLCIFLLQFMVDIRVGNTGILEKIDLKKTISNFFLSQSNSGRLLALGLQYENETSKYLSGIDLFLMPLKNKVVGNVLVRYLTGIESKQSIEFLKNYPQYNHVITFVTKPDAYQKGFGLGSNYNVELAVSFGFWGIILGNIIIASCLYQLDNNWEKNWNNSLLMICLFSKIITLPRGNIIGFFDLILMFYVFIVIVNTYSRFIKER